MSEWKLISTAPKDGTWVFLYVPGHGPARARWDKNFAYHRNSTVGAWLGHHQAKVITAGTHWMPVMDAPNTK